jgi:hypothetical protein
MFEYTLQCICQIGLRHTSIVDQYGKSFWLAQINSCLSLRGKHMNMRRRVIICPYNKSALPV